MYRLNARIGGLVVVFCSNCSNSSTLVRSVLDLHSSALSFVLEIGLASGAAELNMAVHSNLR